MPNCKPNDLCLIHGLINDPQVNGMVVVAVEIIQIDEKGIWWDIQPPTFNYKGIREIYNDRNLHPIRGATSSTQKALDQHTPTHVA